MSEASLNVGYYYRGMLGVGIFMLFVAAGDLALGIANAVVCGFLGSIGYGIWGSVLCVIAGCAGIAASQLRTNAAISANLVFSILAAVSSTVQLAMGTNAAVIDHFYVAGRHYNTVNNDAAAAGRYFNLYACREAQRNSYQTDGSGPTVTDALLASFAIMQGICAIIAAAFSCRAAFCPPGVDLMPWQSSRQNLVKV